MCYCVLPIVQQKLKKNYLQSITLVHVRIISRELPEDDSAEMLQIKFWNCQTSISFVEQYSVIAVCHAWLEWVSPIPQSLAWVHVEAGETEAVGLCVLWTIIKCLSYNTQKQYQAVGKYGSCLARTRKEWLCWNWNCPYTNSVHSVCIDLPYLL